MNSTTPSATLTLKDGRLELRCADANVREDRSLTADDVKLLQQWAARHLALASQHDEATAPALLALGQEMGTWLDSSTSSLTRLLAASTVPPLVLECGISRMDESDAARAFLDAPWELLALPGHARHFALREDLVLTVIRRIGTPQAPDQPSAHRLGVVFMAASPRGADNLNWEAEETAILTATHTLPLDFVVEESGTLDFLAACVAREKPDVVQISCHGTLEPTPGLFLEDDVGEVKFVPAAGLIQKLAAHHPRLLFLSACETAETHVQLSSLAQLLVRSGAQALLGWAASVLDHEATLFSSLLLGKLSEGMSLSQAFAYARLTLAEHADLEETTDGSPRARHWHLARLYFSQKGGGVLATAGGPRRLAGQGQAAKTFLDVKGSQVPVAGDLEFVGRRRDVQAILREFRDTTARRRAGVLIHGMGRQGKSSLAARIARRLEHSHEVVVLFGRYDAPAILSTLRERLGTAEVAALVADYLPRVEQDPTALNQALHALLEGPCRQADTAKNHSPVLLIVDDFEQALLPQPDARHQVKPEYLESTRALIQAFQQAETDSRLLFTSRFQFTLPDQQGRELTDRLLDLPLHRMTDRESRKQAFARLRQQTHPSKKHSKNLAALEARLDPILAAALGNPGLQDLLLSLCLDDPTACDICLAQMENYRATGQEPDADRLRQFLENLAIEGLLHLLTPPVRALLRTSTLFRLPVPEAVMAALAHSPAIGSDQHAIDRLLELGLWEAYDDLHDPQQRALAINALVRPAVDDLKPEEVRQHATTASLPLFESWGAEAESAQRKYSQDLELTRLALLAREPRVLAGSAVDALQALEVHFEYRAAASWAQQTLAILDAAGLPASVRLLHIAAERVGQVGEVAQAAQLRARAFSLLRQGAAVSDTVRGSLSLSHARALVRRGEIEQSMAYFDEARRFATTERERAVVLGEEAHIRAAKGEVNDALKLHKVRLAVYETLGDKRSRAITLGDIARIRANKGEVDAALTLHQEELVVYEDLGDKYSRAVTLGDIAHLLAAKGEVDAALKLHQEELAVYESLDDKRSRAITLGDIANIRVTKGEVDVALKLHAERLDIIESLGDLEAKAQTLWMVAQIEMRRQQWQAAFRKLSESYTISLQLGHLESICFVGLDLGLLICVAGHQEDGRQILERSLAGFQQLGWDREVQDTQKILAAMVSISRGHHQALLP
jgi:tetratricopeptide (TPR) repeat protein